MGTQTIVLFHHIQGLTPGVTALADRWRAAGHTVHTPDLFGGATFDSIPDGLAHVKAGGGFGEVRTWAEQAVEGLPTEVVYAGISMGVAAAMHLAAVRPGAVAGVMLESFISPADIGEWPAGAPVQVHGAEGDEFFEEDLPAAQEFVASREDAELFVYPGDQHLFVDSSTAAWDADAAALVDERVLAFLGGL